LLAGAGGEYSGISARPRGYLHEKTVQVLASVLEFGNAPEGAADAAYLLPRTRNRVARVTEGSFPDSVVEDLRRLGQPDR
jgi:hypothetical protein